MADLGCIPAAQEQDFGTCGFECLLLPRAVIHGAAADYLPTAKSGRWGLLTIPPGGVIANCGVPVDTTPCKFFIEDRLILVLGNLAV